MKKISLFFTLILLASCEFILYDLVNEEKSKSINEKENSFNLPDTITGIEANTDIDSINSSNPVIFEEEEEEEEENSFVINWSNPVIGPYGASLGNFIRAYFLVGEWNMVKKFLINADCIDDEEFRYIMRNSDWGYDIDFTNIHKKNDGSFIMTYKTSINNTIGVDQYYGKVVNDTAKIYFHSLNRKNPLLYDSKYPSSDVNCNINSLLKKIQFDYDSANIKGDSKKVVEEIGDYLYTFPNIKIKINGHTSNEGSVRYNNKLSYDRANSVYKFLKSYGLNNEMEVFGYGSSQQIYSENDENNNPKNRRVEIELE